MRCQPLRRALCIFRYEEIMGKSDNSSAPAYTQNGYDGQLNYQLWSTSRIRFTAAKRLKDKNKLSNQTISFSSAYLILLSVIQILIENESLNSFLTVVNIFLAIVILVLSQLEAAADYSLRSSKFHECGLRVGALYSQLRRIKSEKDELKPKDYMAKVTAIDEQYNSVLSGYENHEDIDYQMFKANYPKYEDHNLSDADVSKIKRRYFFEVKAFALFMVCVPPIILILLAIYQILLKPSAQKVVEYIYIQCFSGFWCLA
ncbi:SLATT domain-containing protein [Vibrio cholerae]|uniref:SLATT domain-containing protein n=6 Tax=Vibrionaceae TaxID=641 RepID=A0A5Q6PC79_VIBCL|nr:SLATT domain-containing protein [Vibrio cholerae]EGR1037943.1 SLATT domain-containing protein [Vibrio cholerae]KAA1205525.1 SLATT domain-containing protein [Vibrio cholerae]KAA1252482.1 SLATT domain-containing protein [Vibrio cholerae]